ncbi:hypothetical protein LUZ61_012205 [Rhynchospora tenuis]|uniref:Uncharacterized protein n=1 Tax=Rhynchospora tenuis TaxID=198213 RepID=A0AAD6A2N9_9POAL|nr:hypothetical protein LUZ61_012205 [Rhynchospora tenuis]
MHMSTLLSSSWRFAYLFSLLIIGFTSNCVSSGESIPTPTPWPEQFNALLFTNHTLTGTVQLQMNDLWYDWPNRRTMNYIQYQLGDYLRDVEWNNGAKYLGRAWADGFECHVYTKVDFIYYYEEVGTGRPVWWYFTDG